MRTYKGIFKPKNPKKYRGDVDNIIYRSGWELTVMTYLDKHPDVIIWSSEELAIPYRNPFDGTIHHYFPDFLVKIKDRTGKIKVKIIEIKPFKETILPKPTEKKSKRTFFKESVTYGINQAKWEEARRICKERGWEFTIITENELSAFK